MRTVKQVAPRAYVTRGQSEYQSYAFGPSPSPSPVVGVSPPPWDGSAEGYGPEQTDYQEYYSAVDPDNPPRFGARGMGGLIHGAQYAGCGGCGVGADQEEQMPKIVLYGILAGVVLLFVSTLTEPDARARLIGRKK